jgi:hypothetical protein
VPLDLRIRVIDHERCAPVANAAVDIWQCNADGVYSDEQSEEAVALRRKRDRRRLRDFALRHQHRRPHPQRAGSDLLAAGGKRSMPMLGGSVGAGITAKIALGVDPSTTPAGVGM